MKKKLKKLIPLLLILALFTIKPIQSYTQTVSDSIIVNKTQLAKLIIENQTKDKQLLIYQKKLNITKKHLKSAINNYSENNEITEKQRKKALRKLNYITFQRNVLFYTTIIGVPIAYIGGILTMVK